MKFCNTETRRGHQSACRWIRKNSEVGLNYGPILTNPATTNDIKQTHAEDKPTRLSNSAVPRITSQVTGINKSTAGWKIL
ncbi:MAG: hypothetical protein NTX48_09620 [Planctomycetales bacterium]|nr:hypothetical protein [Planctomycetales bacterium]